MVILNYTKYCSQRLNLQKQKFYGDFKPNPTTSPNHLIYKSRNFMVILNIETFRNILLIYKSRNFMVILNRSVNLLRRIIYKSRNFMVILNFQLVLSYLCIYKSRNFMVILNITTEGVTLAHLQKQKFYGDFKQTRINCW